MSNTKKNRHLGGGAESKNSLFKPIVATSLALTLGVSVAVATEPSIQTSTNGTLQNATAPSGVSWTKNNGGSSDGFYTLTNGSNPLNITMQFTNNGNGNGVLNSPTNDTYTISQNGTMGGDQTPILQLSTAKNDGGIDMQNKTLTLDFLATNEKNNANWNPAMSEGCVKRRKIKLELLGASALNGRNVAFQGNIEAKAGKYYGSNMKNYYTANELEAFFGGDVIGDLRVLHSTYIDPSDCTLEYSDITANFTFGSGAQLQGNIQASAGESTFAFQENGAITGNIVTKQQKDNDANTTSNIRNRVVFVGGTATIGSDTQKSDLLIKIAHSGSTLSGQMGSNTIVTHSGVSKAIFKFGNMEISGDKWGSFNALNKNFNVLSFNNSGANEVSVDNISSYRGYAIIGKNLATYNVADRTIAYDGALFSKDSGMSNAIGVADNFASNFTNSKYTASGTYTFGSITSQQESTNYINVQNFNLTTTLKTTYGGANHIYVNNVANIKGSITNIVGGGENRLIFDSARVTLGESSSKLDISAQIMQGAGGHGFKGKNILVFNGTTTSSGHISQLKSFGDYKVGENPKISTFNILTFNNTGTNTFNIDSISSSSGHNIIGKDIATFNNGTYTYNSAMLNGGTIQSGFASEFIKTSHSASGTFVIGADGSTSNAISANDGGNYINLGNITINGGISAGGGGNNIIVTSSNAGTNSIIGSISADRGRNTITLNGSTSTINGGISASGGGNNTITFGGATNAITGNFSNNAGTTNVDAGNNALTLGSVGNGITILTNGGGTAKTSITAGNLTAYIKSMTATGNRVGNNDNIITATSGSISIDSLISSEGNTSPNNPENKITLANGNLTFGTISATGNGANIISFGGTGLVTDNITKSGSGVNNFTYTANNSTLTLQGATSQITNLTAYAPSSRSANVSTLVIDGSQRANDTTIDNIVNGGNLIAKFNGTADNSATLNLKNTPTLKQVVISDNSTNNILNLTQTTGITTITDSIQVASGQALTTKMANNTLNVNQWNTTSGGTSTIAVGGTGVTSAGATLKGGNVTLSALTLQATNGASMTLQNSSTTIGTLTSSSTSGDKLVLGFDSPSITTQTNDVSATINGAVSGNVTLVFNGGEDRSTSLTLSGDDKTFKAIQLGSNGTAQSTHNTLILNEGKTTITDTISVGGTNTQEIEFSLANGTELALTGGLNLQNQGFANLGIVAGANATLSGSGTIGLTNLNMPLATTNPSASTLTFKNTTTNIGTLDSKTSGNIINTLVVASGSTSVANTTDGTIFNLTFNDNGANSNQAKSFTLTGGENTIKQVLVNSSDTGVNTLSVTGGSTTIDTINASSGNLTLALSSDTQNPSDTLVTINNAISGTNVSFSGGVNPADQVHFSTLLLKGANNTISSVSTNATNAKIVMKDTAKAEITTLSFNSSNGGSLLFGFEGTGDSTITLGDGNNAITIGDKQTLGISIGGSGTRNIKVVGKDSSQITFAQGSTLVVDFQETKAGDNITATLGNGNGFTISGGSSSIINLRGGKGTSSLVGGVTLDGGNNTVNFIGNAKLSNINLKSGTNTINVYEGITGIVDVATTDLNNNVGNVTNIINLKDNSTLQLVNGDTPNASLVSSDSAKPSTLNFLGEGATLQGGFGADGSGTATINVGTDSTKTGISGLITGNVSGASIAFKGTLTNNDSSKLTLQGSTNTISSLTTSSNNGILVLNASKNAVNVGVSNAGGMTIESGKSITIALHSEGTNNANFNVANGGITVNGTLGIAISGSGTGNRAITANGGSNGITFGAGSTLRVDFLAGSRGSATLGGEKKFEIDGGKNSIINFYAGSTATLAGGGLVLNGGTNTVNFYGNATLGQIELKSGDNNINVKDDVTAKIESTASSLGSVNNTINLGVNSILQLEAGVGTDNGDGSIVTTNTNTLNFEGANATLKGGFGVSGDGATGSATINVKNAGAVITGNVSNAGVNFSVVDGSTLTLQGTTNTLKTLGSTTNITGTVILDASDQEDGVSAEITTAVASNSSVGLKFGAGGNAKTFKFSAQNNTLSGVAFDESGSTNNKIAFTNGSNTITNPFSITQGQGLTIALGDDQTDSGTGQTITQISLELTGGFSQEGGSATLRVEGQTTADALISGGEIDVGNLDMVASTSASLTLKNSSVTIGTLTAQNGSNTLKLDASSNAVNTTISNTLDGDNLTIALAGAGANNTAILDLDGADNAISTLNFAGSYNTLNLNEADNTIGSLTLETSSTNNTLALNKGETTISNGVNVTSGQGVSFNLADNTSLAFSSTLANAGTTAISLGNGASLSVANATTSTAGTSTFTLANNSTLTFTQGFSTTGGTTAISLSNDASGSITGTISNSATTNTTLNSGSSLSITQSFTSSGGNSTFALADNTSLVFGGGLSTTGGATALNLNGANINITGSISNANDATTSLTYNGNNVSLALNNGIQDISTLTLRTGSSTNTLNLQQAKTTIGNALTLDNSKNLNVNIDGTSSLTLANVTTSSGALRVNGEGSLTATNITGSSTLGSNTINVGKLTINSLTANQGAQNTITADTLTISGNISADSNTANSNKNIITANTATFSGNITSGDNNGGWLSQNFITINDKATFSHNTITAKQSGTNSNTARTNSFQFNGQVNGTIAELTSAPRNEYYGRTKNILSFNNNAVSNLKITDINKESSLGSNPSGYVYIGANIETKSVENKTFDLVLNLDDSNWSNANFQASNLTLTIQNLNAKKGKNYINVGTLYVGDNSASGSINASDGGVNNIALGKDSKIKGDITSSNNGSNNIVIQGSNATLTLEGKDSGGTSHAITTLNASGANTTLVLDNSNVTSGAMRTTISTLNNGANLTATLKGKDTSNSATLTLNGGTLKALTLGDGSTGNILDLSNATAEMSIANQVNVGEGQDLTIKLKNTTLALNGGLSNNGGTSTLELVGDNNVSNATLTGSAVVLSNVKLGATDSNTLNISSSSAVIDSITTSGSTSNTLALNNTHTTIKSAINVSNGGSNNPLSFDITNSTLIFGSSDNTITSLSSNGGLVDLSQGVKPQTPYVMARGAVLASNGASARNTLTMQTLEGTATFKLYASKTESDRVEFGSTQTAPYNADTDTQPTNPSGVAIISITGGNDVFSITESDNVVVATRTDNSVDVVGGESYIGGAKVGVTIGAKSDNENTFIIKNAIELEADPVYQEVASSALAVNYDLYLANFNSLNKRMGELRNTQDSNGVWARVFGGAMSNDFGAGSKTQYVTAQAGYDYSLSVGDNARNFIGIAVAYGTSDTKGNASYASSSNNAGLSLDKVNSNMVEVGLYNSYVADSGWYNDTILKFDYIMSDFSLSNDPSTMSSTSNFAMVLSDEFGYRYSFGENEKGSWYIDPQAEFAFGYFNQSDFNRAVDSLTNIKASQDAILTLRSRIGATLGKKFNTEKGFASLYVGASYEYDYIEGGNSGVSTRDGGLTTQLDKVESNGRAVLNVGSNIELTKGARLYIDVEKSFGDKQRTFMQFNLGARYSF